MRKIIILLAIIGACVPTAILADTVRTQAQLLTIFEDGQPAGSITPEDMRDLVVTLFGAPLSVTSTISAAGTTQGTCTTLSSQFNDVTVVAAGTGVCLQAAISGSVIYVSNYGANVLKVYPSNGTTQINSLGNGNAITIATGTVGTFIAPSTTQWRSVP